MNVFKPELFQGSLKQNKYFEGWYFKHVSKDLDQVYSFIPGISLNPSNPHTFIQIINGLTGETSYIEYPVSEFTFSKKEFRVEVNDSVFTAQGIVLNINSPQLSVTGRLSYSGNVKYPSSALAPCIMGWYSFVPFMECKHGVVSVTHRIDGTITVNNRQFDFSNGKGYIEKDWGKSFPESWIWLQSNNFEKSDACIMMSIAKIPWLGSYFTGFLGFLYFGGQYFPFSTYHKSEITDLGLANEKLTVSFSGKKYNLKIIASLKQSGILFLTSDASQF